MKDSKHRGLRRRYMGRRKGISLVGAVIFLLFFLLFAGLMLDTAKVYFISHQLQNAADAAALAGAQVVKYNHADARARAIAIAGDNYAAKLPVAIKDNIDNDPNGEVVLGRWVRQERQFYPGTISANAIRARGNRPGLMGTDAAPAVALVFGPIADVNTANVSRFATAVSVGSTGAGIICLADDPSTLPKWIHPTGLRMVGGSSLDLRGVDPATGEPMVGDIQVNSISEDSPWAALIAPSSGDIYAGELNVVGTTSPSADDADAWSELYGDPTQPFSVNPHAPSVLDPLADIDPPDISTMAPGSDTLGNKYYDPVAKTFTTITGGTLTLNPGYYPGGINMSGGNITLNPGVYALGGGDGKGPLDGLVMTGGGTLTGNGVMLYITGDPDGSVTGTKVPYGEINLNKVDIDITSRGDAMEPPQISGELGIALWQDRDNKNFADINGSQADINIQGVVYSPSSAMRLTGSPDDQMGCQVITGALEVAGGVSLGVAYDGRNTIEAMSSYLVE